MYKLLLLIQLENQSSCSLDHKHKHLKLKKSLSALFQKSLIWTPGSEGSITITFGTGCDDGCSPEASWSQVGKQSNDLNPSMNLGFIDPPYVDFIFGPKKYFSKDFKDATRNYCVVPEGSEVPDGALLSHNPIPGFCDKGWEPGATVIHEFCHALGMLHEHQNNLPDPNDPSKKNPIVLDVGSVINYYRDQGMTEEDAQSNVIDIYDCDKGPEECDYIGSRFDPDSIMLYALPDDWIKKGHNNPTRPNFKLSSTDIEWLKKQYPKVNNYPQLTITFIDSDEPMWKQAWVQKIIIEKLLPIIGVGMRFVGSDDKAITIVPDSIYQTPVPESDVYIGVNDGTVAQSGFLISSKDNFQNISDVNKSRYSILLYFIFILFLLYLYKIHRK